MALRFLRRLAQALERRASFHPARRPRFPTRSGGCPWDYLRRFKTKGACFGQLQGRSFALVESNIWNLFLNEVFSRKGNSCKVHPLNDQHPIFVVEVPYQHAFHLMLSSDVGLHESCVPRSLQILLFKLRGNCDMPSRSQTWYAPSLPGAAAVSSAALAHFRRGVAGRCPGWRTAWNADC